ncbi:unnamed protein product, partial [Ectocarpus sp. 12 AP-2014]
TTTKTTGIEATAGVEAAAAAATTTTATPPPPHPPTTTSGSSMGAGTTWEGATTPDLPALSIKINGIKSTNGSRVGDWGQGER